MHNITSGRTVADLPPGTLVRTEPGPFLAGRLPTDTGVVISAWGISGMVLIWFWGMGEPIAGRSVHAFFPAEAEPLPTTLLTLPAAEFATLAQLTDQSYGEVTDAELIPLAAALRHAALTRIHQNARRTLAARDSQFGRIFLAVVLDDDGRYMGSNAYALGWDCRRCAPEHPDPFFQQTAPCRNPRAHAWNQVEEWQYYHGTTEGHRVLAPRASSPEEAYEAAAAMCERIRTTGHL